MSSFKQLSLSDGEFQQVLEAVHNRVLRLTVMQQRYEENRIQAPEYVAINLSVLLEVERKMKSAKDE